MKCFYSLSMVTGLSLLGLVTGTTVNAATCTDQVQEYTVAPGDTLSVITQKVFGGDADWHLIYEYPGNHAVIGRDPNVLTVGEVLKIPPCPGSVTALPSVEWESSAPVKNVTAENLPTTQPFDALQPSTIYIVTGDDKPPYVDSDWPQGGLVTLIVRAAFEAAGLGDKIRIHHVSDWKAQLEELLPDNRYQLSFGWSMPDMNFWKDCSRLRELYQIYCKFEKSDPIVTVSLGFFHEVGRSDLKDKTFEDMASMRLCRPEGWSTFEMLEHGIELNNLVRAERVEDCFDKLLAGEVDYVIMNRFTGVATAHAMGIRDNVRMASFTVPERIYLLTYKDNPMHTMTYVEKFNEGLKKIIDNGTYSQITSHYNNEFQNRVR
ncbi:transporter substrate-binding domain-containing protein [Roseibium aggregatum]|uniref:Transporter substrate-binding domain-containing protein n=1 Tax=Roseibium aggregatum TaxID=187304 RepID=A0A939J1W8_9HYPH|nr:transporter substrate-binding domain-containing protein [Roseibium aggregatum]MBN9670798.1 transporter substrate-binding domain-containing protein [Roseibium aggregatum]